MTALSWFEGYGDAPVSFDGPLLYVVTAADVEHWVPRVKVLQCTTWGEVKDLGMEMYCEVLDLAGHGSSDQFFARFQDRDADPSQAPPDMLEDLPGDDDAFNAYDDIGMCSDGDWPPSIYSLVTDAVPFAILEQYGEWWFTTINGMYGILDASRKDAALRALIEEGHTLAEDPRISRLILAE